MRKPPKTNNAHGSFLKANSSTKSFEKKRDFVWFNDTFPLTPALSLGERGKRSLRPGKMKSQPSWKESQFGQLNHLHGKPKAEFWSKDIRQSETVHRLSPLPEGEGQGEGEARELSDRDLNSAPHLDLVSKRTT